MKDNQPTPAAMEYKSTGAKIEVKSVSDDGICHIKAYGCCFGNIDSWGDIILPGALDAFLASDDAARMALCWQHDFATVIGKITGKGVDDYGMWFEADVLPTTAGKDAAILLKAGAIDEFSIGYRADKYHYEKRDGFASDIRILDEITIYEVSPVTRAANDKAILLDAKSDPEPAPAPADPDPAPAEDPQPDPAPEPTENDKPKTDTTMEEKDIKAMVDNKAAEMQGIIDEQKTAIDNLDKTVKDQQALIDELKARKEEARKTFFTEFKNALESRRGELVEMLKKKEGRMHIEFKADVTTADITAIAAGAQLEPGVSAARIPVNAFYDTLIKETVEAERVNWLEGTFSDAANYVAELTAAADDDIEVVEKSRNFGKVGAHLRVSSEVVDWFNAVYNWARTTAIAKIYNFIDGEIAAGNGSDATYPKHVYGLTTYNTAFTALGAYPNPTIADVILDCQAQAQAAGYTITDVFLTWAEFTILRGLKNTTGNYLYDEVSRMFNGVNIHPTAKLSAGKLIALDINAVRIKERPVFEVEIVRNAQLDGWDVYVRKAVQCLVKSADKAGVIYVDDINDAITDITPA